MWPFLGVIGFLAFIAALIIGIVHAVKRNVIWKKWLIGAGVAFILFIVGVGNTPPQPTQQPNQPAAPTQQITTPTTTLTPTTQTPKLSDTKPQSIQPTTNQEETKPTVTPTPSAPAPTVSPAPAPVERNELTVYITKTGHKYHLAGCRYLSRSQIPISLSNAKAEGYTPCSVCNPPE